MTEQVVGNSEVRDGIKRSPLPAWQNWLVMGITLTYLICEMAFNSRLLDLVGTISTAEEVHNMERYGRTLTAIAAALLVLQFALVGIARLKRKNVSLSTRASVSGVLCLCLLTGAVTWHAVEWFIERQVSNSTGEFRQMSLLAQLYQQSLIDGHQTLEGIPLDSHGGQAQTWSSPSGKAFLAMLPILLSSVDRYHELLKSGAEISLAGGKSFTLPFGKFHVRNITPDSTTGIGRYTAPEIARILRYSVAPDGSCIPILCLITISPMKISRRSSPIFCRRNRW